MSNLDIQRIILGSCTQK